jgi:amidase
MTADVPSHTVLADPARCGLVQSWPVAPSGAGKLDGLNFVVKDVFDLAGRVSGYGSPDWKLSHDKASANAPVVNKLLAAVATLTGVTQTDELAFSLDGINAHYGTPLNWQDAGCIPGGSSSGSGSMCAFGFCDFALGTDTAGSVRVPAAYQGIYGLRTTHGAISLEGVLPLGPSFDTVGIFARSPDLLQDVASVLVSGNESTIKNVRIEKAAFLLLDPDLASLASRVFNTIEYVIGTLDRHTNTIKLDELARRFGIMRGYEAWQAHGEWYQTVQPNLSPTVRERLLACREVNGAQYQDSFDFRLGLKTYMRSFLPADTAILLPTTWSFAPLLESDSETMALNRTRNIELNSLASFCGLPQINIPFRTNESDLVYGDKQEYFGFSLVGAYGCDLPLIRLAQRLKRTLSEQFL